MNQTPEQLDGLMRRLTEGGCPVLAHHGYKVNPIGLLIEKIPGMSFNSIFDLKQGGASYAIELALRNEATRPIDIVGWQIRTPWGVPMLSLLPAPKKSSNRYPHYCFPEPGPYFEGDFCINRHFARRKSRLQPGEQIEGVLVASCEDPIPLEIPHLARVIVTLRVFDSRQNAFSAQFRVPVNRRELIAREKRKQTLAPPQPCYGGAVQLNTLDGCGVHSDDGHAFSDRGTKVNLA